ncbi:MAG TPA: hypothetical protein VMU99_07995 [Acidimicrobiales bacterium]|nr:hypothetical protein [Acidimicrobiales bacterium]
MTPARDDNGKETSASDEELRHLRREIERLRKKNEELLRIINERDFERPPHYL